MNTPSIWSVISKLRVLLTRKEKWQWVGIGIFSLASSLLELLTASVIVCFAQVLHHPAIGIQYLEKIGFSPALSQGRAVFYTALMVGTVYVTKNIVAALESLFQNFVIQKMNYTFQDKLLSRYAQTDYAFYLTHNTSQCIQVVRNDTELMFSSGVTSIINIFSEGLIFLSLIGLVIYMKPDVALAILGIGALIGYIVTKVMLPRLYRFGEALQEARQLAHQNLTEFFYGFKEVILLGKKDVFIQAYCTYARKQSYIQATQSWLNLLPRLVIEVLFMGAFVLMIAFLCFRHESLLEMMGLLGGYLYVGFRLMPGLNRMIQHLNTFKFFIPSIERVYQAYTRVDNVASYHDCPQWNFQKNIVLKDVCFRYPNTEKDALSRVSFEIQKGECIGIVGETGSGKSTLVDLLLGLLKPYHGSLLVDGAYSVYSYSWHKKIGYVPQSIFLTDDSIEKNIAFGEREIEIEKLNFAIEAAQLRQFIDALPKGAQTIVGERGVRLSGGERQRIAIARALYRNPEVLIFDEATSALDPETEARLMETITSVSQHRTVIMIAHRVSTLANCHRIIVMDQGKLKRTVTYADLRATEK